MSTSKNRVKVWDLPVRLFHWVLVLLVIVSFITGNIGGNLMPYHLFSGYAILTLVIFRILWGFFGSTTARFSTFVYGPYAVINYLKSMFEKGNKFHLGHNPVGGLSVIALLLSLLTQAVTGLFTDDEIATQGPLAAKVSGKMVSLASQIHHLNRWVLVALVVLHLSAILFYRFYKRHDLIGAMFSGHKDAATVDMTPGLKFTSNWIALLLLGATAGVVYYVVNI